MKTTAFSAWGVAGVLLLAACNGASAPAPFGAPPNISGEYAGSLTDNQLGAQNVTGILAQHGYAAGGTLTLSGSATPMQISLAVASSTALSGTIVIDDGVNAPCTFSTTATYSNNGSSASISGSYAAVSNCAGESGTYTLSQTCSGTVAVEKGTPRKSASFPPHC